MTENEISSYTEEDDKFLSSFYNTIVSANQLGVVLEESRATVLSVYSGEDKRLTLLDKKYIEDLNNFGFWLYRNLINRGLIEETTDILECETPQKVNFDKLIEFDKEYKI